MWKISGATVQGLGHEEHNIPCQDKIYSLRENGVTAIALADGAGSARLSHYGAEEAVKAVCVKLCADFRTLIGIPDVVVAKREILSAVTSQLESLASKMNCGLDDLASTLIAAASDDEYVMLVHIGDGIAGYFRDGNLSVASYPDNGEFKNETVFTTSPDALPRMRLSKGKAEGISGFILMSDCTAESFYDRKEKKAIYICFFLSTSAQTRFYRDHFIYIGSRIASLLSGESQIFRGSVRKTGYRFIFKI